MHRHTRSTVVRTCLVAAAAGMLGFAAASSSKADDKDKSHAHDAAMQEHMKMMQGPDGPAMMQEMMLKMAVHQHMVGQMAKDDQLQQMAKNPQMMKAIQQVKASLTDHATVDAKKAEIAKDHNEAMMVMAHAMMKQDKELEKTLKQAEEGKEHHNE